VSIPEVSSRNRLLQFLKRYFSPVSFSATMTSNQTISHDTYTTMACDTETISGTGYDTSTYTFTAPYSGIYYFYACALWLNMADTNDSVIIGLLKNSGLSSEQQYLMAAWSEVPETNADYTTQGSLMLTLNANDTVEAQVRYYNSAVATEQIFGHSDTTYQYTRFCGYKI